MTNRVKHVISIAVLGMMPVLSVFSCKFSEVIPGCTYHTPNPEVCME